METLIVGAGPTGMTAALVLAANGVGCRIIDKRPEPSHTSRALGLQARSMEVLAGLGVAERVEKVSYRLFGASIMNGDRPIAEMDWVPPESRYPYTYVVPQAGLEAILRGRLDELGVRIDRGAGFADVSSSGATATLDDGRTIEADWIIGADGARSRVREAAGIAFPQRSTGEVYYLADVIVDLPARLKEHVRAPDEERSGSAMWLGPQGPFMLMRLPGGPKMWRVFVDMSDTAADGELPPLTTAALEALMAERGPRGARVEALRWSSVFRTRLGLADTYRCGRVFLAGDAAHVFPPFGGQGMNLGIQDAVNLAWRLAGVARGAPASLLDGYGPERRPVAAATIRDVEARRRLYALRNPLARGARDLVFRAGASSRGAKRRASLQNSQLTTSYRHVFQGGRGGPFPRAGDRAPDGRLGETTVHELLGPDHVTLLLFDPRAGEPTIEREPGLTTATIAGQDSPLRRAYGLGKGRSDVVLVRPDGHVQSRDTDLGDARRLVAALVGRR
ncbi:FAD-dependent monooxygenase [Saccharomonospora sp. NPDC006951]